MSGIDPIIPIHTLPASTAEIGNRRFTPDRFWSSAAGKVVPSMHEITNGFALIDPTYDRLVHRGPTRSRESTQILDYLRSGHSAVVVCLTGDGALDFARSMAMTLEAPEKPLLRVSSQTTVTEVRDFLDPAWLGGGPRIICGVHLLPAEADSVIGQAIHGSRVPVAYLVDGDRLRAAHRDSASPLRQIASAWTTGVLERLDLARLTSAESLALVSGLATTTPLDDLQLRALAALSAGRPLLADDLVTWAEESPHRVPRRYPHSSVDSPSFGTRPLARLTDQYPQLRADTLIAARRLGALAPMPLRTARQLFGDTLVSRLIDLRLAREFEVTGQPSAAVSPLHVAALDSAFLGESEIEDDAKFRRRLWTLWHAGYPIGEVASIGLAREIANDGTDIDPPRARLLLRAARSLNRLGDPLEATIMLHTVEHAVREDPALLFEWELQAITARLVNGDRSGAQQLIRTSVEQGALGCVRDSTCLELLFISATALASDSELPQWWTDFLEDVIDPVLPGTANLVSSFTGSVMTDVAKVRAVADSPHSPPSLRLAALATLCQYHLKTDNATGVAAAAEAGLDLIADLTTNGLSSLDDFTFTMAWFFSVGSTVNCLFAGIEPERSELTAHRLLAAACGTSAHSGWQMSATGAWCFGIMRLLEGEVDSAARDYEAFAASVTPALLAVGWGLRDTVGRWQRSNAPFHHFTTLGDDAPAQGYRLCDGFTAFLLGPGAPRDTEMPTWLHIVFTHASFLDGTTSPAEAAAALQDEPDVDLPGPQAARRHIEAAAAEDAEALLEVGRQLRQVGYRGAARHAFTQARALFLAQRLSARAREAGQALEALQARASVSPENPQPTSSTPATTTDDAPAATLTERELEICRLVAEGLTNVQISQRLVLSVRTVESHVLQARAKLGAERRRDIPKKLLHLRDAGRLNAVSRVRK